MKIGILTFHRASNFGAVLQNYALTSYLNKSGCQCETIDYRSEYLEKYYQPFHMKSASPKKLAAAFLNAPIRKIRKNRYETFRNTYIPLSEPVTEKTIERISDAYDMFVFGSDQIWNPSLTGNDMNYLGKFVEDPAKLASYASSFGRTAVPEALKNQYQELLSRFNQTAVREESAGALYHSLTSKNAHVVMDPVFLLTKEEWGRLAAVKDRQKKYILVYHLKGRQTKVNSYADYLAKQTGLPIIDVQGWVKKYPKNVHPRYWDSPNDFLGWIQNAEYVVTDSFHCTAFSVIFQKKFWAVTESAREENATRVGNLLNKLHLLNRLIPTEYSKWNYAEEVAYSDVETELKNEIAQSKEYIVQMIRSVTDKSFS